MRFYFESIESVGFGSILTFKTEVNWFERVFLRLKAGKVKYRGQRYTWREHPSGESCGLFKSKVLCEIWKRETWKVE